MKLTFWLVSLCKDPRDETLLSVCHYCPQTAPSLSPLLYFISKNP